MYQGLGHHNALANDYKAKLDNIQSVITLNVPLNLALTISILP